MSEKKPNFKWGKKLGIHEQLYGNLPEMTRFIAILLQYMKDTNKLHGDDCEFFRIDFRTMTSDEQYSGEFPLGSLILDLKWGFKQENKDAN